MASGFEYIPLKVLDSIQFNVLVVRGLFINKKKYILLFYLLFAYIYVE